MDIGFPELGSVPMSWSEYYLEPFVEKHISDTDKLKNIIVKTWNKMSENGHAEALKIPYTTRGLQLIKEALDL